MSVLTDKRTYMKADDRRQQILDCARAVFAERGFHVASIADICSAARIGRGTLYQYFRNKRDVFHAVVEELEERVRVALRSRRPARDGAAAANAPASAVAAFAAGRLRYMLDAIFADEESLRLIFREARGLDGGIEEVVRRVDALVLEAMVDDLRFAVESGVIECADPERTALFLLGGIEKLVLAALERDEPVDLDGIVEVVVRIELFGLFSEETRRRGMGDG